MQKSVRPTWAEIDLGAIAHNVKAIGDVVAPSEFCAVVKASAYGHGSIRVAETAIRAGAKRLGVALVEEGRALRQAGIDEQILVLSGPFVGAPDEVIHFNLTPCLYTVDAVASIADAARRARVKHYPVHVKVDTGMNRLGVSCQNAVPLVREVLNHPELLLEGVFTHFAGADEDDRQYAKVQLQRFEDVIGELEQQGIEIPRKHAANSAAALLIPESRFDFVRVGLSMYGIHAHQDTKGIVDLRPAMSVKSRVTYLKQVDADEPVSYGMHYRTSMQTILVTVPIGYGDGVPRRLGLNHGQVLIRDQRFPIAGTVTMDQTIIDCGPNSNVEVGDEVVFLGAQGAQEIDAWEWAKRLDDIPYSSICGVSTARVPRRYIK